jgi:hypothetical protein
MELDYALVKKLYEYACYTLPTFFPPPCIGIINPGQRYCIDLRAEP